jgi:hypothetical protein
MKITKKSRATGIEHTMDLDITQEHLDRIARGEFVQDACPHLSPDEREFLISGTTSEEWVELFPDPE